VSASFKVAARINEETIARKTKELESVLKEKKCVNCVLCTEDIKAKVPADHDRVLRELNESLVAKSLRVSKLEETTREQNYLIS